MNHPDELGHALHVPPLSPCAPQRLPSIQEVWKYMCHAAWHLTFNNEDGFYLEVEICSLVWCMACEDVRFCIWPRWHRFVSVKLCSDVLHGPSILPSFTIHPYYICVLQGRSIWGVTLLDIEFLLHISWVNRSLWGDGEIAPILSQYPTFFCWIFETIV